jgi:hypothetical protein
MMKVNMETFVRICSWVVESPVPYLDSLAHHRFVVQYNVFAAISGCVIGSRAGCLAEVLLGHVSHHSFLTTLTQTLERRNVEQDRLTQPATHCRSQIDSDSWETLTKTNIPLNQPTQRQRSDAKIREKIDTGCMVYVLRNHCGALFSWINRS